VIRLLTSLPEVEDAMSVEVLLDVSNAPPGVLVLVEPAPAAPVAPVLLVLLPGVVVSVATALLLSREVGSVVVDVLGLVVGSWVGCVLEEVRSVPATAPLVVDDPYVEPALDELGWVEVP
jgi:hypothetical protein